MSTWATLCRRSLDEIRAARAGDTPPSEDLDLAFTTAQMILASWNVEPLAGYTITHTSYTLTPSLNPHTIGLAANSPTWTVTTARPEAIVGAILIRSGLPYPVNLLDEPAWRERPDRTLTGQPLDLWYERAWPNGKVNLYPLPDAADTLELAARVVFSTITLAASVNLPDGYELALMLTIAEHIAPAFGQQVSPITAMNARAARARIFGANTSVPRLVTADAGMPGSGDGWAGADIPRFKRGY